ncbi:S9 family peptidase [Nonomuraea typhae]|uniref:S9 family peptidase n=1 Tax=Nonomuraea typhae TaxID=2603600 RepID=UPI0012F81D6B|nr:prolyl oligopeptidase family serine peptidase [Nonomuraea typhae]
MVKAQAEPELMTVLSPMTLRWLWWADDSSAVYYLSQPRDLRTLSLRRMDPVTGEVTTLVSESGPTRVDPTQVRINSFPIVKVVNGGAEVLWYSQRDGWGHLCLYDTKTGELRNQVTSDHPEFYKVGVSRTGNHDNPTYLQGCVEMIDGPVGEVDYAHLQGCVEMIDGPVGEVDYALASNARSAHKLQGKLLFIAGGYDPRALMEQTLRFADRLIAHGKDFDLQIVTGAEHMYIGYEHYTFRKQFDYLVRHLLDLEPPAYRFAPRVLDPEAIAELFL